MNQKFSYEGLKFNFFAPAVVKSADSKGDWIIRGYAATSDLDRQGDVISPEALERAAENLKVNSTVFYEHKHDQPPVGKVLDSGVDEGGLWVEVMISKTRPDIWQLIQEGILSKFSIGGKVLSATKRRDRATGQDYNLIEGMELYEVSIVGLPANPQAEFAATKSIAWSIHKAAERKEKITDALDKIEGGEVMEKKPEENQEVKPEEKKEEPKVEKAAEPAKEELKPAEEKKEEKPAEEVKPAEEKKEEAPAAEPVVEKKEETPAPVEKKEETPKAEEKKEEGPSKEEIQTLVKEDELLKNQMAEIQTLKAQVAEILTLLKGLETKLSEKKEPEAVKEAALDLKAIEETVTKVFDARLGQIRLVPSRKGTLLKSNIQLEGSSEEEAENLNVLLDEKKFNELPDAKRKEVIRKGLLAVIKR